eukprot:CAMPEP_0202708008 /NCGR_PEP_ID=MMETSP1385-20130828/20273_1 /ASSEMBLY_ACC=CAM_ASM_000861 /TAXON_ID=933848 /ORGANISM="Elphidium margaritaceum" /LENGTH=523 /DNA_ID=CAMNT_0049366871 /DNA_START=226 /DNA_END=1794 /DNA_ORIENTATION=-
MQSNKQLELELTKYRQCIEEKASMQKNINDLNWEIEKYKRSHTELQTETANLNDKLTEYTAKYQSSLQQIQTLKVENENLRQQQQRQQVATQENNQLDKDSHDAPKQIAIEQPVPPVAIAEPMQLNNGESEHPDPIIKQQKQEIIVVEEGDDENAPELIIEDRTAFGRNQVSLESAKVGIALVIFCYDRHSYLERTLESIFSVLPPTSYAVFISQQGYDEDVTAVIKKYTSQGKAYWLGFDYEQTEKKIQRGFEEKRWLVYHKISAHYRYAFEFIFDKLNYDQLIVLEDDMEIAPDFFTYFSTFGKLMDSDPSILCVSAWNDYGQRTLVYDAKAVYRTDIFPGLGWMMNKKVWTELKDKWPLAFWDDWLRQSAQRHNRSCIRPEISRVYTFGASGSSEGQFYNKYLRNIELNKEDIDWTDAVIQETVIYNLSPVENYDAYLTMLIGQSEQVNIPQVLDLQITSSPMNYVVKYDNLEDYTVKSKQLDLMDDHKDGLPRQSYRGIVIVRWKNHRILFVPQEVDWS